MKEIKNHPLSLSTRQLAFDKVNEVLAKNPSQGWFLTLTKKPKKRSIPANNIYYAWFPAISDHTGNTLIEIRNIIKYEFGLPIVLADKDIGEALHKSLNRNGFFDLSYREIVGYHDDNGKWVHGEMEWLQISSLMNTKQHNQMRDNILHHYQTMGVNIGYDDQ